MENENNIIYSWKFVDKKEKGKFWYIITISIVLGLAVWGVFTKQYGLSFIIVLLAGIYFFVENNSSDIIEVYLTNEGIKAGNSLYDYSRIEKYSIVYDGDIAVYLRLKLNIKGVNKIIDISIDNNILQELKNILPNFLYEGESEEITSSEKLINYLKL